MPCTTWAVPHCCASELGAAQHNTQTLKPSLSNTRYGPSLVHLLLPSLPRSHRGQTHPALAVQEPRESRQRVCIVGVHPSLVRPILLLIRFLFLRLSASFLCYLRSIPREEGGEALALAVDDAAQHAFRRIQLPTPAQHLRVPAQRFGMIEAVEGERVD